MSNSATIDDTASSLMCGVRLWMADRKRHLLASGPKASTKGTAVDLLLFRHTTLVSSGQETEVKVRSVCSSQVRNKTRFLTGEFSIGKMSVARCAVFQKVRNGTVFSFKQAYPLVDWPCDALGSGLLLCDWLLLVPKVRAQAEVLVSIFILVKAKAVLLVRLFASYQVKLVSIPGGVVPRIFSRGNRARRCR
ncbi:hypothetical protein PR048_024566 [Dryococelus australis]|uniref:Uncharacterized protein n=1 Tax=Dryococelus australis TaxID=614101 RepID=A0ABQ9GNX6_9NEOP|nr:hypothetical protein PR048_024566 [Dryococelus australis]